MNTITYETALKLKNAGFPIKSIEHNFFGQSGFPRCTNCGTSMTVPQFPPTCDVLPTLEELIEACTLENYNFILESGVMVGESSFIWWAKTRGKEGHAFTRSEAVAALWLELNNKQS